MTQVRVFRAVLVVGILSMVFTGALPAVVQSEGKLPVVEAAVIEGTIRFEGPQPVRQKIKMGADPACKEQYAEAVYSNEIVVNDNGTLKNVFVYVKEGVSGSFPSPTTPVVLDQVGCRYVPHVIGVQVNQPLELRNSDATLHNINAKAKVNRPFNIAQPVQGMTSVKKFTKPEIMVKLKCNVHPWMSAYVGVLEHPFFSVSDDTGAFRISGLPAGTYVIEGWQEQYGVQSQTVTVADGETATITVTFTPQ